MIAALDGLDLAEIGGVGWREAVVCLRQSDGSRSLVALEQVSVAQVAAAVPFAGSDPGVARAYAGLIGRRRWRPYGQRVYPCCLRSISIRRLPGSTRSRFSCVSPTRAVRRGDGFRISFWRMTMARWLWLRLNLPCAPHGPTTSTNNAGYQHGTEPGASQRHSHPPILDRPGDPVSTATSSCDPDHHLSSARAAMYESAGEYRNGSTDVSPSSATARDRAPRSSCSAG